MPIESATRPEVGQVKNPWRILAKALEFEAVKKSMSHRLIRTTRTGVHMENGDTTLV